MLERYQLANSGLCQFCSVYTQSGCIDLKKNNKHVGDKCPYMLC